MGEFAEYRGQRIKIGTCESMYYLRADQRRLVRPLSGNVDPVKDAGEIRFRFPFPDEDTIEPGAFEDYNRSLAVSVPEPRDTDFEHYSVQFSAQAGYLVSLPCPESPEGRASGLTIHRNGFAGAVRIIMQRLIEDKLVLVCACGGCGALYRLPSIEDAEPIIVAVRSEADRWQSSDESRAKFYHTVADRIVAGYVTEGRTIWNSDGTDGPALIC